MASCYSPSLAFSGTPDVVFRIRSARVCALLPQISIKQRGGCHWLTQQQSPSPFIFSRYSSLPSFYFFYFSSLSAVTLGWISPQWDLFSGEERRKRKTVGIGFAKYYKGEKEILVCSSLYVQDIRIGSIVMRFNRHVINEFCPQTLSILHQEIGRRNGEERENERVRWPHSPTPPV